MNERLRGLAILVGKRSFLGTSTARARERNTDGKDSPPEK